MPDPTVQNFAEDSKNIKDLENRVMDLELENEIQIRELDKRYVKQKDFLDIIDDSLPSSGLFSHNFFTRAFTVWGHYFIAQLIIGVIIGIGYLLIFVLILNKFSFR